MLEITDALDRAIEDLQAATPDRVLWSGHAAWACEDEVRALIADLSRWRHELIGIDLSHLVVSL